MNGPTDPSGDTPSIIGALAVAIIVTAAAVAVYMFVLATR